MSKTVRILALSALLALGACNSKTAPQVQGFAAPVVPSAQPLTMRPVKWKVYTMADLRKIVEADRKNPQKDFVLYALTESGYKDLSSNLSEVERFMQEQGEIVLFLKKTLQARENIGQSNNR